MAETDYAAKNRQSKAEFFRHTVPDDRKGQRLDHFLVDRIPGISRSRLNQLIRQGCILVNGSAAKAGSRLKSGDSIEVALPPPEPASFEPEKVDFGVLYEDGDLLVIAKPPGIVVHPAAGHKKGTLVHGLLDYCSSLSGISGVERPGIVHRLDKDTSGLMVIAKGDKAHQRLVELFKARQVQKIYHAIVAGRPQTKNGCVSQPIGRHRGDRKKMAVLPHGGRDAVSRWTVLEEFADPLTYLEVRPQTGRTHQIRVHMAYCGFPVAGDPVYGGKELHRLDEKYAIRRQCLHAYSLSFDHPCTGRPMEFVAPVWPDMLGILAGLRELRRD